MQLTKRKLLIELKSGNCANTVNRITQAGINLEQVNYLDEITLRFLASPGDFKRLKKSLKSGETITLIKRIGSMWRVKRAIKHPLIVGALVLTILCTVLLPHRVLFLQVEGNIALPQKLVLEQAKNCGIGFWSRRSVIRSEKMKNALLTAIPELKWAAVTTKGCVATIHLKEKLPQESKTAVLPMNLVSIADGIVQEVTVLRGTPLCKPGDAVSRGQVLISGYTDCGLSIRVTGAEGEVYGLTERDIQAVAMKPMEIRGELKKVNTAYFLRAGKKYIKLYKDSGILDTSCVKIKSSKNVHLPGGRSLPVEFVKEVWYSWQQSAESEVPCSFLNQTARAYVQAQMQAGEILKETVSLEKQNDTVRLTGIYACREMIGQTTNEEFTGVYG